MGLVLKSSYKYIAYFLFLSILLILVPVQFSHASNGEAVITGIGVKVNGKNINFDSPPYINKESRTMVPIRFISEELGGSVGWVPAEKKVVIKRQGQEILLWIGKRQAQINNQIVEMDTQAELVNGRTMVPLRFISESFGAQVQYVASERMVVITTITEVPGDQVAVVTSNIVNIRSGPGVDNNQVGQVRLGDEFKIVGQSPDKDGRLWYQIEIGSGQQAWIASWLVNVKNDSSQDNQQDEQKGQDGWAGVGDDEKTAIVIGSTVNIRKGPDTDFDIITKTRAGDVLQVIDKYDDWYYVKTQNGTEGWISGNYISIQSVRDANRDGLASRGTGRITSYNGTEDPGFPAIIGLEYEELDNAFFLTIKANTGLFYSTMFLDNPQRLVIDIQGTKLDIPLNELENVTLNHPFIKKIRVAQFREDVSRIVLEFTGSIEFETLNRQGEKEQTFFFTQSSIVGKLIVIDPGHGTFTASGISDPGAIGPSGLRERDVVMDISNKLADMLKEKGAEVVLTRTGPTTSLDLGGRVNLANSLNADIYVSIHANASLNSSVMGSSTYYYAPTSNPALSARRAQTIRLAQLIQESIVKHGGRADLGIIERSFKVIRETNMPSVLVETAFISNPTEEKLLNDPSFRTKIARGIAEGIEKYFN